MEAPAIKRNSLLITLLFHGVILFLLWWFAMNTKIPPFGGGGGAESANIGFVEIASGDIQPLSENVSDNPRVQPTASVAKVTEQNYATQETEESAVVETKKEKKEIKKEVKVPVNVTKTEVKKIEPVVPKVNAEALYPGKKNISVSQGTGTSGSGDQGVRDGDPNSLYQGKGQGQGGNGSGGGEGDGSGPGKGSGSGPGFSYELAGRAVRSKPSIYDNSQETGKVVVAIKVDKYGNVVDAVPGARGSTTTSTNLFRKAKEAALKAKFNPSPDGVEEQRGTITFVFVVQ
jgi:TonB family protein